MKLKAPPYSAIVITFNQEEGLPNLNERDKAEVIKAWPNWWPSYCEVLLELFASYECPDLLKGKPRVSVQKLIPNKQNNAGANLLLRFSFDDTGTTWDIFQKGRTIVHAQPVF